MSNECVYDNNYNNIWDGVRGQTDAWTHIIRIECHIPIHACLTKSLYIYVLNRILNKIWTDQREI